MFLIFVFGIFQYVLRKSWKHIEQVSQQIEKLEKNKQVGQQIENLEQNHNKCQNIETK